MENLLGQTLGQYRIVEQIGQGGMATVYKAYQPSLDRYVAIKILPAYFAHEPGFAERFTREARAVARLNHPYILPIYDFGQQDGLSYIVMKYVDTGTLHDQLGSPLSLDVTARLVRQIALALDHAHECGILHRDIKPSNVLLDKDDWVLLTDFGLAKMVEGSAMLTASGVGVGTPAYMAPEQGRGDEVDERADIYSLGIVLYEMVTGRVPFQAETPMAVVIRHITDPLPLPRTVNPDLPEAVERVILKALAKASSDRYARASDLADALDAAVGGGAALPTPMSPTEQVCLPAEPPTVLATPSSSVRADSQPVETVAEAPKRAGVPWKIAGPAIAVLALIAIASVVGVVLVALDVLPWGDEAALLAPATHTPVGAFELPTSTLTPRSTATLSPTRASTRTPSPPTTTPPRHPPTHPPNPPTSTPTRRPATQTPNPPTTTPTRQPATHTPRPPTATPTQRAPTPTPQLPTSTPTPTAMPLPGVETVPLAEMAPSIPWLPLDAGALPAVNFYGFNHSKPPFNNVLVRQAFALAVDRDQVVRLLQENGVSAARPATTFTHPETLGRDLYGAVGLRFDPDRARRLLAEAGYPDGQGFPQVSLHLNHTDRNLWLAEYIVSGWREVLGVDVGLELFDDWGAYVDMVYNDAPALFRFGWGADINDPGDFLARFSSGSDLASTVHFSNAEYDQLLAQAADAAGDPARRQRLYIQAERILCEEWAAVIPLFYSYIASE